MPLGALLDGSVEVLEAAGLDVSPLRDAGRRLVVEAAGGVTYITTRPSDVPTYVEAGAADLGIAGVDVLREREPEVVQLLDLGFGGCRMAYATIDGPDPTPGALEHLGVLRVATKYPRAATEYFAGTGRPVEVVKVNGSVELAPLVGLSDGIVDLVATGRTLRENGLVEREHIFDSTARLIANRVAMSLRAEEIGPVVAAMAAAVAR
ncbi:MAG: ATP phosphoribosyltransferase [Miltoncostaeaceae bacterium]